jgi:hypothetical protein
VVFFVKDVLLLKFYGLLDTFLWHMTPFHFEAFRGGQNNLGSHFF